MSLFLLGMACTAAGGTIYVDADASGANNGSSWADAYNFLQDALAAALSGDEVRVAEGIYKPDQGAGIMLGDRTATFQLKNGVVLKGGYAGAGTPDTDARDIAVYETILSGDLDGNDVSVVDPADLLDEPTRVENSYHVVTGSTTDATVVLDGFIITGGNANGSNENRYGGGMYNDNGNPTVTNCTFSSNSASISGGGMENRRGSPMVTNCTFSGNSANRDGGGIDIYDSSPTVTNCTFSGNSSYRYGGGMVNLYYSSPTVTNCIFNDNSAGSGGGMFISGGSPKVSNCTFSDNSAGSGSGIHGGGGGGMRTGGTPTVTNCVFSGNCGAQSGGGIFNTGSAIVNNCMFSENSATYGGGMTNLFSYSRPKVTNCIFSNNSAMYGGGIYNETSISTLVNCTFSNNSANYGGGVYYHWITTIAPTLTNCILWGNEAPDGPEIYIDGTSSATVSYSDVQGGWEGEGNIDADPCFVEPDYLGPVSHWKFDEGGGVIAYDSAGNNDGTLVNGPTWTTGQIGGALSFGGDDGVYVEGSSGADSPLNIYNSDLTISAWVKLRGPGGTIVARAKPHYITYRLLTWSTTACISVYAPGHHYICSDVILNQDTWYHMVGVFDRASNTGYLYIDGILEADGSMPDAPPGNDGLTKIGCRNDVYDYPFNGIIDDVAIYDRALSGEEIQQLYHIGLTGHSGYHLLPVSPCINAGDPSYIAEPNETDLDGRPRVIGGRIDMGAYEFNHIPVADAGPNQTVEAQGAFGARVTLDGSGSSDADSTPGTNDDIVSFDWYKVDACDPNFEDFLGSGEVIDCNLPLGEHIIVLEVIDKADAFDTNEVTIIVQDTTPPDFTLSVTPTMLWPVNHKMVLITPSWTVSDICDASPEVSLVSITMNEDDEAIGDGHTTLNIQIGDDGSIHLRAERSGAGSGRIYTITYQAVDDSGNVAVARATVTVPHDQR